MLRSIPPPMTAPAATTTRQTAKPTVTGASTAALLLCVSAACVPAAAAQPAETFLIDQTSALAGNVTPGDEPGFPVTLSRSGHYRLGSDLQVPASTSGIVITAPDVTLDLGGHSVRGPVKCVHDAATLAVTCDAPSLFSAVVGVSSVRTSGAFIRNGSVSGFAGLGVHYGEATVLDKLQVRSNAGVGIAGGLYAMVGRVRAVLVQHNGGPGIVCDQMRIEASTFAANGGTGVDCRGSWFIRTVTRHNGGHGVAEGSRHGLRSFGNRLGDEVGVAADRMPAQVDARR